VRDKPGALVGAGAQVCGQPREKLSTGRGQPLNNPRTTVDKAEDKQPTSGGSAVGKMELSGDK